MLYLRQSVSHDGSANGSLSDVPHNVAVMPPARRPLEERFWPKVDRRTPDECWPWLGAKTSAGYGHISRGGAGNGNILAHRVAYEFLVGPIPENTVLDHTCHGADQACPGGSTCPHRACCNPAHAEPVPFGENCMRGRGIAPRNSARTHCLNGHPLSGSNVRLNKNGARVCRICAAARLQRWKDRHPEYVRPSKRRL